MGSPRAPHHKSAPPSTKNSRVPSPNRMSRSLLALTVSKSDPLERRGDMAQAPLHVQRTIRTNVLFFISRPLSSSSSPPVNFSQLLLPRCLFAPPFRPSPAPRSRPSSSSSLGRQPSSFRTLSCESCDARASHVACTTNHRACIVVVPANVTPLAT